MNIKDTFTHPTNIEMLWEILLDELHLTHSNPLFVSNTKHIFESIIPHFTNQLQDSNRTSIMEINKQFLAIVLQTVNTELTSKNMKRIIITNEEYPTDAYKVEDIQTERKNALDKEVEKKRLELESYMNPPEKTRVIDFTDKFEENTVLIDTLLAEKIAERNTDIPTLNPIPANKKKVSFENGPDISLNLSGEDVLVTTNFQETFLNKLKPFKKEFYTDTNTNANEKFAIQESMPLPVVTPIASLAKDVIPISIKESNAIVPNQELVQQINSIHQKIDVLFEMVTKLTEQMYSKKQVKSETEDEDDEDEDENESYNYNYN